MLNVTSYLARKRYFMHAQRYTHIVEKNAMKKIIKENKGMGRGSRSTAL